MSQKKKRKKQKNKTSTGKWLKKVKEKRYRVGLVFEDYDEVEVTARTKNEAIKKAEDETLGQVLGIEDVEEIKDDE